MCLSSVATIVNAGAVAIPTAKLGAKREHYSEALGLRIHSAASRLSFSKQCEDTKGRFALTWFSFNAAYSKELGSTSIAKSVVLDHQCVYQPLLNHHSCILSHENWQEHSKASKQPTNALRLCKNKATILGIIFCRLYILRNQLTHDGITWINNASRNQLRDVIAIFGSLLPALIHTMMANKFVHLVEFKTAATHSDAHLVFNK